MLGAGAMTRIFALLGLMLLAPATGHAICSLSASGVAFGVYNPSASAPTHATGSVTVNCRQFIGTYTVGLSAGLNGGGNISGRRMSAGTALLAYQLYTDAGHTMVWGDMVWGDGTGGSVAVHSGACLSACNNNYTVHGRIAARQAAIPGIYGDTIVVTVTFF
jgi:spore coat protein U-like protein